MAITETDLIRIDSQTYDKIRDMAHKAGRTIGGQVRWMTSVLEALDYISNVNNPLPVPSQTALAEK